MLLIVCGTNAASPLGPWSLELRDYIQFLGIFLAECTEIEGNSRGYIEIAVVVVAAMVAG